MLTRSFFLLLLVMSFTLTGPVAADVRITMYADATNAGEPVSTTMTRVRAFVELQGGEVLFEGTKGAPALVLRMREGTYGALRRHDSFVDRGCLDWDSECSRIENVSFSTAPGAEQAVADLIESVGSEVVGGPNPGGVVCHVDIADLSTIYAHPGVLDIYLPQPNYGVPGFPNLFFLPLGLGHRFQATADWSSSRDSGRAYFLDISADTGAFYFFRPENIEIVLKVLNGCSINNHYWVYLSGLTDLATTVRVSHGFGIATYTKALGVPFTTVRDLRAFPCS